MKLGTEFELNEFDPRSFEFAFKGKGSRGPSAAEVEAQKAQQKELAELKKQEEARTQAMARARRGRASLMSGSETGDRDVLGG